MGLSACARAQVEHNKQKVELKAKRRMKIFNAYVNVKLGHRVPWTVNGNEITNNETGKTWTLCDEEIKNATKKAADILAKREAAKPKA